jgi:SAM-dependent methyltransferase
LSGFWSKDKTRRTAEQSKTMRDLKCVLSRLSARTLDVGLNVLSTLGRHPGRKVEYDFALSNVSPATRKLLDIGSAGSSFPLKMAMTGLEVTAVDVRPYCENHPNVKFVKADAQKLPFPDKSFGAVTCISTIEHVGLSAYGDPRYDNGDSLVIEELRRVLWPRGRLILTTPYGSEYQLLKWKDAYERIYDQERINALFTGWKGLKEEYYVCKKWKDWAKSTKDEATKVFPSYPRSNLSCFVFEKP